LPSQQSDPFSFTYALAGSLARITVIVGPQVRWAIFKISAARSPMTMQGAKKSIFVEMAGRRLRGKIVDAKVVSVKQLEPQR
jgi:hypothetical protein